MNAASRRPGVAAPLLTAVLVIGALLGTASAQQPATGTGPNKAVAVIHCDYPPVSFWDKNTDRPSGFFVEIMDIIGRRAGLQVTYVCRNGWPEMIGAIESGAADLGALMKSAERERRLLFTAPIEMTYLSFFSRSQGSIANEREIGGRSVGVITGSMSFEQLKSRPDLTVRPKGSYQEGLFSLLAGEIDLFAGEESMILKQARETGLEGRIRTVGRPFLERERGIAVRKDDAALLARLDGVLPAFIGSPEYQRIYLKWYGKPAPFWTARKIVSACGLLLLLSVCAMAFWRYRSISNLNRELTRSIAERKRAEQIVLGSEARLRQITDNMVDMVGQFDERSVFRYASPSYERILGYRSEELVGTSALEMIHPDDRDEAARRLGTMLAAGAGSVQFRQRHRDGSYRWIESTGRNVVDGAGNLLGSILGSRDITERKDAESARDTSEAMVRSVLDSVDEGFIVVDREYRILTANRAYCAQLSVPGDRVIGRQCHEVSHRSSVPCHEAGEDCAVRRAFETGEPCVANHTHRDADGQMLYVETRAFPVRDEAGAITSAIESVTNMTEKHLLEQERLKTQKLEAIGTLAGGIAHDFNNLLQGVFGYISLARLKCDDRHQGLAALAEAEKALHLSVKLTNQLLTFSKGGKPIKRPIPVRPTVESAVKFALSGSRSGSRIRGEQLWRIDADEGQIAQVVQNIVLNADQAMPEGGQIDISLRNVASPARDLPQGLAPGDYVEIAIADTGVGIPAHQAARIFDPYFTTKEKGSGLGLATSYSIIRNHGGLINVKSEPGNGATFSLYLPATREQCRPAAAAAAPGAPPGRAGRVLVMDDEEVVRNVAGELIKALGHDVDYALHGEEALAKYRAAQSAGRRYDAVILDLTIRGGMGGAETLRRLLIIDQDVAAVVSSGYSDDAVTSNYREHGFKAFLKKPYDLDNLQCVLAATITAAGHPSAS
jgi:PAS domain S-box-containing protein